MPRDLSPDPLPNFAIFFTTYRASAGLQRGEKYMPQICVLVDAFFDSSVLAVP